MALAPEEIAAAYRAELGAAVVDTSSLNDQAAVVVAPSVWVDALRFAKESSDLDCDFLAFISAIDWVPAEEDGVKEKAQPASGEDADATEDVFRAPEAETFQMLARVYSSSKAHGVTIKANLPKESPSIETAIPVYAGADWHERELMEMFGIDVLGHPNPTKLYLPDEFEGHPLRKDYKLGAREVKPWPGAVEIEDLPEDASEEAEGSEEDTSG